MIYEYNLADHLGNIRITFGDADADGLAEILQENQYYPFGMAMTMASSQTAAPANNYLYNGKELQDELDLGWYDYGARMYDASIGRWNGIDPMTDLFPNYTGYHYVHNNPLVLVDPTGMVAGWYQETANAIPQYDPDVNSQADLEEGTFLGDEIEVTEKYTDGTERTWVGSANGEKTGVSFAHDVNIVGKGPGFLTKYASEMNKLTGAGLDNIAVGTGVVTYNNPKLKRARKEFTYNALKPIRKVMRNSNNPYVRRMGLKVKPSTINDGLDRIGKTVKSAGKFAKKIHLGPVTAIITAGLIYEDARDGRIKPSSVVDGALLLVGGVAMFTPLGAAVGLGIAVYGAFDFAFDTSEALDREIGHIEIPW